MSATPRFLFTVACVCAALGYSSTADAQDKVGLTLAAGAVFNATSPPAEDFTEPFFLFNVQKVIKRYFVLEGDASYWAHTSRSERGPHTISGPNGVLGTVQRSETVDTNKDLILGLNFLVRSTGKVRIFGGGGAAIVFENSDYEQQDFGCSPSLDPRSCSRLINKRLNGPFPLFRVLGGVEVPVTNRVAIVGAARLDSVTWEGTSNTVAATTGVRFSLP